MEARLANSALLALLEKYWMYREKFEDTERAKIRLAGLYRKRNLPKHFLITLREARRSRERRPWRHADYYHDLNLIEWEQYQYDTTARRTESLNLQATSDMMDTAFIARKLRLACLARSHQAVFRTDYQMGLLEAVLQHVETTGLVQIPAIGLYFHCYHFLNDAQATAHFEAFKAMLFEHAGVFPPEELRTMYLLAINYGIKKINESSEGWLRATLELYQSALQHGLLLENQRLSRFAFNNIVAIALRVGEVDWAEKFILDYKPSLERQWREVTSSLNLARVAYARKDFPAALSHLQRSDYKDLLNNLIAKTLQLKIYYETDEYDLLDSHLTSMSNFIRRHTAIGYHRTNYSRIVYYTRQLMAVNLHDPQAVTALRSKMEQEEILTEKEWLLGRVDVWRV
ncbi:MAG: hypothetical protein IPL27_16265 [Lewinellaceae bacterium]|nr:hypothetical protein [Lewinellaceae bacterium]